MENPTSVSGQVAVPLFCAHNFVTVVDLNMAVFFSIILTHMGSKYSVLLCVRLEILYCGTRCIVIVLAVFFKFVLCLFVYVARV